MLRTIFPKKAFTGMHSSDFRRNSAMNDLMQRPEFKEALKTSREKEAFFAKLQKYGTSGERGLTQKELRPMLEELRNDHMDHLTDYDIKKLSKAIMDRHTGKYIKPDETNPTATPKKTGWF